jgi:hypothetical protein
MPGLLHRLRDSLEETHSTAFELRRHFFLRFFDSDFVSEAGQWRVLAIGVFAILASLSLLFVPAYYGKYMMLNALPTPDLYRLAALADVLFLITLAMFISGLVTTFLWPSLFPNFQDYLALASLPIRMRDVFVAKFTGLIAFALSFIIATILLPSAFLPAVAAGKYSLEFGVRPTALFVSSSLAALFVFLLLVAVQGVLLNVLPARQFERVSLTVQGALLTVFLCGLPVVLSIPDLHESLDQWPHWAMWAPPAWFLGLHEVLSGRPDRLAIRLAWLSLAGVIGAGSAATATYLWSYRRHRVRLLESAGKLKRIADHGWIGAIAEMFIPDPRELAVFAFSAKTLPRTRQHRLILITFAALAVAVIFESFFNLSLSRGLRGVSFQVDALRKAAISAPLTLSLFLLAGLRYVFRLPVDLGANWAFRINELGNCAIFLGAVQRFLVCCAVLPVVLLTLPMEVHFFGLSTGMIAAALCLLPSLALMGLFLIQVEAIPFTSCYLPGRRPVIETLVIYLIAVSVYVSVLSRVIIRCLERVGSELALFGILLTAWLVLRMAQLDHWGVGKLEFEELPEPVVMAMNLDRD